MDSRDQHKSRFLCRISAVSRRRTSHLCGGSTIRTPATEDADTDDAELVALCLSGRADAFRPLVERYGGRVTAYVLGHLCDRDAAEEAVQETFVRAFASLDTLKQPGRFAAWLLGIARLVSLESIRAKSKWGGQLPDNVPAAVEPDADYDDLRVAVLRLPIEQRRDVLWHHYAGRSCEEIAAECGVAVGTVTSRLSRAYATLRAYLSESPLPIPPRTEGAVR